MILVGLRHRRAARSSSRVLLDKNCKIEPGCVIGEDPDADRERFPFVTESGIVVVPKGTIVPAKGPFVLANDVAELIGNEPELRAQLRPGTFVVSMHEPPQLRVGRAALQEVRPAAEPAPTSCRRTTSDGDVASVARILHVTSEVAPFAQTGGLADVVGGLPAALAAARRRRQVAVVVPLYRGVAARLAAAGATLGEPLPRC